MRMHALHASASPTLRRAAPRPQARLRQPTPIAPQRARRETAVREAWEQICGRPPLGPALRLGRDYAPVLGGALAAIQSAGLYGLALESLRGPLLALPQPLQTPVAGGGCIVAILVGGFVAQEVLEQLARTGEAAYEARGRDLALALVRERRSPSSDEEGN